MSRRDIWPFNNRLNSDAYAFPVGAGTSKNTVNTSWREGEVLIITAASSDVDVAPAGTIDPAAGLAYLAKEPSEGMIVKAGGLAATTGTADGDLTTVYGFESGLEWSTRNVFSGSDTNIGPAGSGALTGCTIGADCDLYRAITGTVTGAGVNGDFGIDLGGDYFTITRLLNSLGQDVSEFGGTVDRIVFARLGV